MSTTTSQSPSQPPKIRHIRTSPAHLAAMHALLATCISLDAARSQGLAVQTRSYYVARNTPDIAAAATDLQNLIQSDPDRAYCLVQVKDSPHFPVQIWAKPKPKLLHKKPSTLKATGNARHRVDRRGRF